VIGSEVLTGLQDRETLEAVIEGERKAQANSWVGGDLPMGKRRGHGTSKKRAIQNALARLGMQASPKQVVAFLANFGIDVNEALVRRVKVEMLKQAARVQRQQVKVPNAVRSTVRRPAKVPPRRSFRS